MVFPNRRAESCGVGSVCLEDRHPDDVDRDVSGAQLCKALPNDSYSVEADRAGRRDQDDQFQAVRGSVERSRKRPGITEKNSFVFDCDSRRRGRLELWGSHS